MIRNSQAIPLVDIPVLPMARWRAELGGALSPDRSLLWSLFAIPGPSGLRLYWVCGNHTNGELRVAATDVDRASYDSLTPEWPQASMFEREIYEQWNCKPVGHPWLKPVRFAQPLDGTSAATMPQAGITEFYRVEGEEIHEVAVGPVHAGIIEPGHFRFQCHGEHVHHLEISLGYQHRGIERHLLGPLSPRTVHYMHILAGDTSIAHGVAFSRACEALAGVQVPDRAHTLRAIMLELERCANHTGDLGALAGDVAYLPTLSYCGRLRGDFLNMSAMICGSRFGRDMVRPGGVRFDIEPMRAQQIHEALDRTLADVDGAAGLLFGSGSVVARFQATGVVSAQACRDLGVTGMAARASGVAGDVRSDYPDNAYTLVPAHPVVETSGDVLARARVRWLEIHESVRLIHALLDAAPRGAVRAPMQPLRPHHLVVSLVEGWRGPVCHCAVTDEHGGFAAYRPIDPSLRNWRALALALRGQQISDFPLCNKSFNLSYCGSDL